MSHEQSRQIHPDGANRLHLTVKSQIVPFFFLVLQKGFMQKIQVGCFLTSLAYLQNTSKTESRRYF
jgi:hypothetical protein